MENETLNLLWPIVSGILIVPMTTWLKAKIPSDYPLSGVGISQALSLLVVWGLAQLFAPLMTFAQIVAFALGTNAVAQLGHAAKKTHVKLNGKGDHSNA